MDNEIKNDMEKDFREIAQTYLKALDNSGDTSLIEKCKKVLETKYDIKDIGKLKKRLKYGMDVV